MSREVGVSVICMLPWSLGRFGLNRSLILAHNAGFDGLQILPLRGWEESALLGIPKERIISFELAWNCGSIFKAALRHLHLAGEDQPLFHDWLFFGKCKKAGYRADLIFWHFQKKSLFIAHSASARTGALEMHPELELTAENYARYPHGLVWDTMHVLRPGRHGQPPIAENWRALFEKVKYNIRLIHIKSSANLKMLEVLAKETVCPVIFEDRPPLGHILSPPIFGAKKRMLTWLKDRRNFLERFFG